MAGFTDYTEDLVLDWLLTSGTATRPTAWYVALYTVAPTDTGGGTEVSGTSYARTAVTFSVSGTSPATAANSAAVEFPEAGGSWGTVVAAGIFDASTAGNLLAYANLTASKAVDTGDVLRFNTSALTVTLD
ncbi:MAG: hypothetical protein VW258_16125 [Thalassolituus sp.]